MNISDFENLKQHTQNTLHLEMLNINNLWKSLYNCNYIRKDKVNDKWLVLKINKNEDYASIPLEIEAYIFSSNKQTIIFNISSEMDKIPIKGLNKLFHRKQIHDITLINDEIEHLWNIKEELWARMMCAGTLPIC